MLLCDERAHIRFRIGARSDFEAESGSNAEINRSRSFSRPDGDRNCHGNVRRRSQGRAHESVDRLVHVGIGHDDHVVFGAGPAPAALSCRRGRLKM